MNKMLNISLMALAFASASLNVSAQTDAATPAQQKADVDLDAKYATNLLRLDRRHRTLPFRLLAAVR